MADNATRARGLYEAWNKRDFQVWAEAMAPDGLITIVGSGDTMTGPEGAMKLQTMWADAFPDGKVSVDRVAADGDRVVVELTGTGKHTGVFATPMGSYAPTGRPVTLHLCDFYEFEDGKIAAMRSYFDSGSLMTQLGLSAGAAAATTGQ